MHTPFAFPALPSADLAGRTVALVARPFDAAALPADAFAVHINKAEGWKSLPRCDELFTVTNANLARRASDDFRAAAAAASVIRWRKGDGQTAPDTLDTITPGLTEKTVAVEFPAHPLSRLLTSGIAAAIYYEARGATVILCGFSRDRLAVTAGTYHTAAALMEAEFIRARTVIPPL